MSRLSARHRGRTRLWAEWSVPCVTQDLPWIQTSPLICFFVVKDFVRPRCLVHGLLKAAMTPEEDLVRIAKKLDKMVSRNSTEGALDLLKELRSLKMTLKLLQETRIGMSVNSIRKHCTDEEAVSLAKFLIKDWKRLLDSGRTQCEKSSEGENGLESSKKSSGSHSLSPEMQGRWLDVKMKSDPDRKPSDKNSEEKQEDCHTHRKMQTSEPKNKKEDNKKPLQDTREKRLQTVHEGKKPVRSVDQQFQKHKLDRVKDGLEENPKRMSHGEELKREKQMEQMKTIVDDVRKEKHRKESWPIHTPEKLLVKPQKPADVNNPPFKRQGVLDSSVLCPSCSPSSPRPPPNLKCSALDVKTDRKDDSASRNLPPTSPPAKKSAAEVKKERKIPPEPNAPIAPLPLHLHPPPQRKEPPDPNTPLPPLPLHLHPPPPGRKHPFKDGKMEKDRKVSTDSKLLQQKHEKRERKDSVDCKISKKLLDEAKKERKDSSESKPHLPKEVCVEVKKEKRKDSSDCKPGQLARSHSSSSKLKRQESTDSKRSSSPPAKKLTAEGRESVGSKPSQPGRAQRKLSTDTTERKGKPETPRTPTTPTSPMSPSFSSAGGVLPPHLATGDSIRDKCIEMLAAALRADNDHAEFGANCDSMAAEIEDYIYQTMKATDMKYKNKVRSRISNLKDPKNPGLRRNVLAGRIELSRIATMSAEEMASDELKQLRNVLTQEAIREHQMAKTGGTTTDLLQCDKCNKKNCTYNQVQTRSADEPMTTFVLCNECGNRWKFC